MLKQLQNTESTVNNNILVLSGYGLSLKVDRGRLIIVDGFANEGERRTTIIARSKNPFNRLVILGHSGTISLEAISWLMDAKMTTVILNPDGEVITSFTPNVRSYTSFRRSQALAPYSGAGIEIIKYILLEKIKGQKASLAYVSKQGQKHGWWNDDCNQELSRSYKVMDKVEKDISQADGSEQFLLFEAQAAAAYWRVWKGIPLNWPNWAISRVPEHWMQIQSRASGKTGIARHATDPTNAIINYLYSLLEAEAKTACLVAGLDPEFGLLHADKDNRTSFVFDIMEPARPVIDRYIYDFLIKHSFRPNEIHETREGVCRIDPVLAQDLTKGFPNVQAILAKTILDIQNTLSRYMVDGIGNKSKTKAKEKPDSSTKNERADLYCLNCGEKILTRGKKFCSKACFYDSWRKNGQRDLAIKGSQRLKELREAGQDPIHGGEAARKRGEKIAKSNRLNPRKQKKV